MIRHVTADLLLSDETVIAHGCNTLGLMGAGIAAKIAKLYPEVHEIYEQHCRDGRFVVGTAQYVWTHTTVGSEGTTRRVFNLGTQRMTGSDASLWAIVLSFGNMFEQCVRQDIKRVAIPRIGCGIGGLKWSTVEFCINGIYEYQPDGPDVIVYTHPSEANKVWD